jgi:hypothetical protein
VEKSGDGKWHEVEDAGAYGEEYKKYDQTVIGRALVLLKLEEATMLRATTLEESFTGAKCSYVDAAGAFDKRIANVLYHWWHHLYDAESESWKIQKGNGGIVDIVVSKVTRYMETFKGKEVELSPDRKRKHEAQSDDIWEPWEGLKHKKRRINMEAEARGTIMNPSKMRCIRSRMLALKDGVEDQEARKSEEG